MSVESSALNVARSAPRGAVFLSYASQDAEAAKRIADSLRAAGVEVWFDQNELVGGDAWDAKIRKQIKDCALLIPIISAATQARTEGYFRLEWRLADQRTHLMAKGRPFLLPVVIDDTRDAEAHVPDSFTEVQWTRLPGGEGEAVFAARVKKLLGGAEMEPGRPRPGIEARGEVAAPPSSPRFGLWLALAGVAVVVLGLSIARPWQHSGPSPVVPAEKPAAQLSEARKLANQAMQLLEDPNFTRETSWLADELCQRALALDAGDAEVWAVAAFASHNLFSNTYDTSAGRREKARSQAARASQLDPQSVRAALAVARCLEDTGNDGELLRMLQELHRRAPADQEVLFSLVLAEGDMGNEIAVLDLIRKFRALPRTDVLPLALWFEVRRLRTLGRYAEAETILDEMLADPVVLRGAYYEKLNLLMRGWYDLAVAAPFIEKIPARFRQEPAFGSAIAYYWLWRAEPEKALQALAQVPQDYFEEYAAREPKGYLTGWAHALAQRPAAAQAEWRAALALVEERLKTDARNTSLLNQRALLLALTSQREAAREAWQLRVELGGEQNPVGLEAETQVRVALNEPEAALAAIEREWARRKPMSRVRALPVLRYHPAYAAIRGDPRLQRILQEDAMELQRLKEQQTGRAPTAALAKEDKSVAVLAFANLSDDKNNEYFSDGISEELLNVLAKVPGLKVSARTSAFYFKGKEVPVPEIAKQLGVAYVVEGSVRKAGDKVRITAQLIKAVDGFHVWSDTFTRDLKDIFAVQDEIAGLIAKSLELKIGVTAAVRTVDPEAYQLYLQALPEIATRTMAGFDRAEQLINRTIARDPGFVPAQAALAVVWCLRAVQRRELNSRDTPLRQQIIQQAERALKMGPDSAEAQAACGFVYTVALRFTEGEAMLRRAIQLNPSYAPAYLWLGRSLLGRGYIEDAIATLKQSVTLDPLSHRALDNLAFTLVDAGRLREALGYVDQALGVRPESSQALAVKAQALARMGRVPEALALIDQVAPVVNNVDEYIIEVNALAGRRAQLDALLAPRAGDNPNPCNRFYVLAALGRDAEAFEALDQAIIDWGFMDTFLFSPLLDRLRTHPRFIAKLQAADLTEIHARAQAWRAAHPPEQPEAFK